MDSEVLQNESLIRFASPILNKSDIYNMTIIQTGNGTIVAHDIFLNTTAAQALSGIFVWSALLLTCHQVGYIISVVCLCTCFDVNLENKKHGSRRCQYHSASRQTNANM